MTNDGDVDTQLRTAMFEHLSRVNAAYPGGAPSDEINSFYFNGEQCRLVVQPGIRKPKLLDAALTIRTTYTPSGGDKPYEDKVGPDGSLHYNWRGTNPNHSDNRALREAMRRRAPLAYFVPVTKGVYRAIYPVYLVDEDPDEHEFSLEIGDDVRAGEESAAVMLERHYTRRFTLHRLHQIMFRPMVMRAYDSRCTVCDLGLVRLLDAAHILPDRHPEGNPIVSNGLALCKIHHAAYDADIIGIRPDYVVEVQSEILNESGGPMLRHGIQGMHGVQITLPRQRANHPDPYRLEKRYTEFRVAGQKAKVSESAMSR